MNNEEKLEEISNWLSQPVDIKKVEELFSELGVNIRNNDGSYKKFVDVLGEVSKKFNEKVEENNAD